MTPPRYPPPRPKRTGRYVFIAIVLIVTCGLSVMLLNQDKPGNGDCLASTDYNLFSGYDIVDCSDSSAQYEVVNWIGDGDEDSVCEGYDGTEVLSSHDKYGNLTWAVCLERK